MTRWILVVEDERALAAMICDNLRADGYATETVADGPSAIERSAATLFDLVILDIMLPGCDGFEVLRTLRARGDDTPVLMLSARSADEDRIRGLELRADDYLTKPFHLRELLLRVGALLRRAPRSMVGEDVLTFDDNSVDFRTQEVRTWRGDVERLTDSESRLLRLIAARRGEIVSRREIVDQIFGPDVPTTTRTVDNLVLALRKTFERDPAHPRHIVTVRGRGWRFDRDAK